MKIGEIEKGVPIRKARSPRNHKYFELFRDLVEPGDSRLVTVEDGENATAVAQHVRSSISQSCLRGIIQGKFSVKIITENSFRIWRVS